MAEKIDRKKVIDTFHSWCQGHADFAALYKKLPDVCMEFIEEMLRDTPKLDPMAFQSHYYCFKTGWSNKTQAHHRSQILCMGHRFLSEYARGRIELGTKYPEYKRPTPAQASA